MIDARPDVAIFWDFGSCPSRTSSSGHAVADNVRSLALRFGVIKSFIAYLAVYSDQEYAPACSGRPRALALRSELQSSGVTLTDVPYGNDAIGKTLLVDMLAYAFDHTPAKVVLMVITADHLLAYALSVLRMRDYRVVLLTSDAAAGSGLISQASACFKWECNEGERSAAPPPRPTSPRQEGARSSKETGQRLASEYDIASSQSGSTASHSLSDFTTSTSDVASSPLTIKKELDAADGVEIPPSVPGSAKEGDLEGSASPSQINREEDLLIKEEKEAPLAAPQLSAWEYGRPGGMDATEDDDLIAPAPPLILSSASSSADPTIAAPISPLPSTQDLSGKECPANDYKPRSALLADRPYLIPTAKAPTASSSHPTPLENPSQPPASPPIAAEEPPCPNDTSTLSPSSNPLFAGDPPSSTPGGSKAIPSEGSHFSQTRAIPAHFEVLVRTMEEYRERGVESVGRSYLSIDLPKRQPDVYARAGIYGTGRPLRRYIDGAIESGILVRDSAEHVSLARACRPVRPPSPPTCSTPKVARPRAYKVKELPSHFGVLYDVMAEFRRSGGRYINCDCLGQVLLRRLPNIYTLAGVKGLEKPLEKFIDAAIDLGILMRVAKRYVSLLMPEIPPHFVPLVMFIRTLNANLVRGWANSIPRRIIVDGLLMRQPNLCVQAGFGGFSERERTQMYFEAAIKEGYIISSTRDNLNVSLHPSYQFYTRNL